jgi:hypothetical protein
MQQNLLLAPMLTIACPRADQVAVRMKSTNPAHVTRSTVGRIESLVTDESARQSSYTDVSAELLPCGSWAAGFSVACVYVVAYSH